MSGRPAREGRGWLVAAGASSMAALALGGAAAMQAQDGPAPELGAVCLAYDDLRASLNTRTLQGQIRIRAAAAQLADLADRYPDRPTTFGRPVHSAAGTLKLALGAHYLTARDLFVAACPVAEACGHADQCRDYARLDASR